MGKHYIVITEEVVTAIKAAVRYAFEHPIMPADLAKKGKDGVLYSPTPAQQNVKVPPSTWCIFSVERHPHWVRHLSIALDPAVHGPDACPDVTGVECLLQQFDFERTRIGKPTDAGSLLIHVHEHGRFKSLNVFEPVTTFPNYVTP